MATRKLASSVLDRLGDLRLAVDELANTWRPEDPGYRADIYRQIIMDAIRGSAREGGSLVKVGEHCPREAEERERTREAKAP